MAPRRRGTPSRPISDPPRQRSPRPRCSKTKRRVEADAADERFRRSEEDAVNANRAGHLPTMSQIEHALAEPEPAPTLVGRYSAGGANYMIFSDGSIEAETETGAFKFASMGDFKAYLAGKRSRSRSRLAWVAGTSPARARFTRRPPSVARARQARPAAARRDAG